MSALSLDLGVRVRNADEKLRYGDGAFGEDSSSILSSWIAVTMDFRLLLPEGVGFTGELVVKFGSLCGVTDGRSGVGGGGIRMTTLGSETGDEHNIGLALGTAIGDGGLAVGMGGDDGIGTDVCILGGDETGDDIPFFGEGDGAGTDIGFTMEEDGT